MQKAQQVQELEVYQESVRLQQDIFELSKTWPKTESYSLTDQIRRSSRSVGANLAEAWAKRRYPAHFLSKLTDADGELSETRHWIFTAHACGYIDDQQQDRLTSSAASVGGMLGSMIAKHRQFCLPT